MIGTQTTWGLTGPAFLWMYAGLCAAVAVAIRWQWQQALGPRSTAQTADLDTPRLAMLNGGPALAIMAAATRLHKSGVLRDGDLPRTLVVAGPLDSEADDLERAVFDAVEREPHIQTHALRGVLAESEPVKQLASRLTDVGLLVKPEVTTKLRRLWLLGGALVLLGSARIWAGLVNDASVTYLAVMVIVVALATFWLACKRPWATERGLAVLARQRRQRSDLSNGGAGSEIPLAIALYGGGMLWMAEPAIASTWNVPRESASAGSGSYGGGWGGAGCGGWSGGGSGDGGGGGGGGCGGGCGGGS